jgi:predicted dehydrogenase/threonine dehydrogenase-like Zn-dependent dehydrogenase
MKQLVQDFKTGDIKLVDVPPPVVAPGCVLVRNAYSLVSAGTEKATVAMAQASFVGKARMRPDLAKQVFSTLKREGIGATLRKVQSRLDQWKQLGYSSAGTVLEVGEGVTGFAVGDRVACAGQDYASHAEMVLIPQNLCTRLSESVTLEHAAFSTLGAIALQVVLGIEVSEAACELAKTCGCDVVAVRPRDDVERSAAKLSNEFGVDAVIITASAPTNDPVELAGKICRERGRVVMVGVTGMEVPRDIYYRKELDFRLSRSYGPGRYDPLYEEQGIDYPIGYVRWTEGRNMEAFAQLLAAKRIDVAALTTHTFSVDDGPKAYELITGKTGERVVGVLIQYPATAERASVTLAKSASVTPTKAVVLGVIGAGNYAQGVLLPQFKANADVTLRTVCTATGVKAQKAKEKFGFDTCVTDWRAVIADGAINTVLVATRHDLHAPIVCEALKAGKAVFVEKPLCLRGEELDEIIKVINQTSNARLLVGFNRRFAPFAAEVRKLSGPLVMRYRVSVTPLPREHWINNPDIGGGRILGEVCHFVDFLQFAARSRPVSIFAQGFGADNVQVALRFADGSVGAVDYFSVADAALEKERFEAFGGGRHLVVTDFSDKGQAAEVREFITAVKTGGPMPMALEEIVNSTRATLGILQAMRTGQMAAL